MEKTSGIWGLTMMCLPRVARWGCQKCGESVGRAVLPQFLCPSHVLKPGPAHPAFPAGPAFPAACDEKACAQARHCHGGRKKSSEKSVLCFICLI